MRDGGRTVDAVWRQYTLSRQVREPGERTLAGEMAKLRAYLDALVLPDLQIGTTIDTWGIQLSDPPP